MRPPAINAAASSAIAGSVAISAIATKISCSSPVVRAARASKSAPTRAIAAVNDCVSCWALNCDCCASATGIFVLSKKNGPIAAPELAGIPVSILYGCPFWFVWGLL